LYAHNLKNLINKEKLNNPSTLSFQQDTEHKIINTCFLNALFSVDLLVKKNINLPKKGFHIDLDSIIKENLLKTTSEFISQSIKTLEQETQYYNKKEHDDYKEFVSPFSSEIVMYEPKPEIKTEKFQSKKSFYSYWLPRGGIITLIIAAIIHKKYGLQNVPTNIKSYFKK